jgi:hypothetical protein
MLFKSIDAWRTGKAVAKVEPEVTAIAQSVIVVPG